MKRKKPPKGKPGDLYTVVWRDVDSAIQDVLKAHPEYFTEKGKQRARESIIKRVAGRIVGAEIERRAVRKNAQLVVGTRTGSEDGQVRTHGHKEEETCSAEKDPSGVPLKSS